MIFSSSVSAWCVKDHNWPRPRQLLNFQRRSTWFVTKPSISYNSRCQKFFHPTTSMGWQVSTCSTTMSIYFQTIARIWPLLRLKAFFLTTTTLNSQLFGPHKRAGTWKLGLFYRFWRDSSTRSSIWRSICIYLDISSVPVGVCFFPQHAGLNHLFSKKPEEFFKRPHSRFTGKDRPSWNTTSILS